MYDGDLAGLAPAPAGLALLEVTSVSRSATHSFAKTPCEAINLLAGRGVEGDAHCGATDQHLFLDKPDPPPNLRQLHLFPGELMQRMREAGFAMAPGAIGENVVTWGVDLLDAPLGAELVFPSGASVRLTGRRTPCRLVDRLGKGLMKALGGPGRWGEEPIAGVMAVVESSGRVRVGDRARVIFPPTPHTRLPGL